MGSGEEIRHSGRPDDKLGVRLAGVATACVIALTTGASIAQVAASWDSAQAVAGESSQTSRVREGGPARVVPGPVPSFEPWSKPGPVDARMVARLAYKWVRKLEPNQAGRLWLAVILMVVVAFDVRRPLSSHNADLILLFLPGFLLFDLVELESVRADEPGKNWWFQMTFLGIFLVSLALLVRSLAGAVLRERSAWAPNLPRQLLIGLTVVLFAGNVILALGRYPNDAGNYTNLGAKRFLETGHLPYGDPMLRGGASATYGPLLYVAHVPFQLLLSAVTPNPPLARDVPAALDGRATLRTYVRPPVLATKLTLLMFFLASVVALVVIGRRLASPEVGWALACLYVGSAYVQGLGGEWRYITGVTYISHIAPAAVTLLGFAALHRPFLAGSLLAGAAGLLFYPAFFLPAWLGYVFWRDKKSSRRFIGGFLAVLLLVAGFVGLRTYASGEEGILQVVYESTVGHQEAKAGYGASTFGFWGTHPRVATFWQSPLIPNWHLMKPSFIAFAVLVGGTFFLARGRTLPQIAFLTAAVAIAIQLWKSHAGGTYVEWYYPFLLIGLLTRPTRQVEQGTPARLHPEPRDGT